MMFHSPVSETKDRSDASRTVAAFEPRREVHARFSGVHNPLPEATQAREFRSPISNQAMLRSLSRAAGGTHARQAVNKPGGTAGFVATRSSSERVYEAAGRGIATASTALPHREQIQASFGSKHDVSAIPAHIGGVSAAACHEMGATAFAAGGHVAFARTPDIRMAAHEAAHVVQQARGVHLYGGVGVAGDVYERHADAVADRVAAGHSATDLLDQSPAMAHDGVNRQDGDASSSTTETPYLEMTPSTVNFGSVPVGSPTRLLVKVTNRGSAISFGDVTTSGSSAFSATISGPTTLQTGETTNLMVTFLPSSLATETATLTILNEEGVGGTSVTVTGTGVAGPVAAPEAGKAKAQPKSTTSNAPEPMAAPGPEAVSVMQPLPIEANPAALDLDKVEGEADAPVDVTNISDETVVIDRAEVKGGGNAFSILMLSEKTIAPGQAARLAVGYNGGPLPIDGAFLVVTLTTGQQLFVNIVAPAIATTKAGVLKISPDPVIFASVDEPNLRNSNDHASASIAITNPSLTPQQIDEITFNDPQLEVTGWKPITVMPGATEVVKLGLTAGGAGEIAATGSLMTWDGRAVGTFQARGRAESTYWMNGVKSDALLTAKKTWKDTKDIRVYRAREVAEAALGQLGKNAVKTLDNAMRSLRAEWLDYLEITASDPSISSAEFRSESLLGELLEHTLAGGAAHAVEHGIHHVAHAGNAAGHTVGAVAEHAGGDVVEHGGAEIAEQAVEHAAAQGVAEDVVAEAALVTGELVIGFAVGVLIEVAGGMIYRWLTGEDEEIRKAMDEAYQKGREAGAKELHDAYKAKTEQLNDAEDKAKFEEDTRELDYMNLIGSTTDLKRTQQIAAEITAQAAAADPATAKLEKGLTRLLLQHWVREHAADLTHGAKDVPSQEVWGKAMEGAFDGDNESDSRIENTPDLFVDQAMHEWAERRLNPNAALAEKMRGEIGITSSQPSDREQAQRIASRAFYLIREREFEFSEASEGRFFESDDEPKDLLKSNRKKKRKIR